MSGVVKTDKFYIKLINEAYSSKRTIQEVAIENGIKPTFLTSIKRKYGIKTKRFNVPNKRITDQIEKEMLSLYEAGKTANFIAKKYGYKTRNTVLNVLKKHGVKAKSGVADYTHYNKKLFKKIDCHNKAYILGLLFTDGYVQRNYRGVCIQLTKDDGYLLRRIAPVFGKSASVIHINCDTKRKKMPNVKDMCRLTVSCPQIANDLKKWGVVKNKTYCLKITKKIPKKYIYSFLRGVIDGDGSIGIAKRGNIWCNVSTKSEQFAVDLCNLPIAEQFTKRCYDGQWHLWLSGGKKITIRFLKKLYQHKNDFYLERKYERIRDQIS